MIPAPWPAGGSWLAEMATIVSFCLQLTLGDRREPSFDDLVSARLLKAISRDK